MKKTIRSLLPPILIHAIKGNPGYGFFGNYPSWQAAVDASTGYDDPKILEKVREAILAVKRGRAVFERDSVLFDKPEHRWPLLTCLFSIAAANRNSLSVLDFGGALGSTYFQCRDVLKGLDNLEWSVVEQKHFVDDGRKHIGDDVLRFYFDIESCVAERKPQAILFSSVIHYLPKPYEFLKATLDRGFEYIIFDRTPFIPGDKDRLTIQKVPPSIYKAVYPAWFLGEDKFLRVFKDRYRLVTEFEALDRANITSEYKGFLFRKISVPGNGKAPGEAIRKT